METWVLRGEGGLVAESGGGRREWRMSLLRKGEKRTLWTVREVEG